MSTLTADTITSRLPFLSAGELKQIQSMASMLLGNETKGEPETPTERIMFQALRGELTSLGINSGISYTAFSQSRYYKNWQRGLTVVDEFIEKSFRGYAKTETERLGLYRILLQALIRDFKRNNIPVSVGTVANNIHRVPQAFENAFPNYIESGMAYLIPKAMVRGKK